MHLCSGFASLGAGCYGLRGFEARLSTRSPHVGRPRRSCPNPLPIPAACATLLTHGCAHLTHQFLALILSLPRSPNYALPWQMMAQSKSTATGFVVAPLNSRRILTNAHAVTNQVQVMLRKHGNARKYPARVLAVGHECDIAMLTVDNDEVRQWQGGEWHRVDALGAVKERGKWGTGVVGTLMGARWEDGPC